MIGPQQPAHLPRDVASHRAGDVLVPGCHPEVVSYNFRCAGELRGLTQDEAADAFEPVHLHPGPRRPAR